MPSIKFSIKNDQPLIKTVDTVRGFNVVIDNKGKKMLEINTNYPDKKLYVNGDIFDELLSEGLTNALKNNEIYKNGKLIIKKIKKSPVENTLEYIISDDGNCICS